MKHPRAVHSEVANGAWWMLPASEPTLAASATMCRPNRHSGVLRKLPVVILCFAGLASGPFQAYALEKNASSTTYRFLRPSGSVFVKESEIRLRRTKDGLVVTSVTERGKLKLTITSRYDSKKVLQSAKVTIQRGDRVQSATVSVSGGAAHVVRDGNETGKLKCPRNVVVTSAPDWTDSVMAVQRYDRKGHATQKFPGLWVHPTRKPLELTLTLTRQGHDSVTVGRKTMKLDRFLLVLRGGSRYVVWGDQRGRLVRLLPAKSARGGIVLSGWERATRDLKPKADPGE